VFIILIGFDNLFLLYEKKK
jgi:hypothetical protein